MPTVSPASTSPLEQLLIERITKGAIELPLLPQVASRILAMVYDPDAELGKIGPRSFTKIRRWPPKAIRCQFPGVWTRNPVVPSSYAVCPCWA